MLAAVAAAVLAPSAPARADAREELLAYVMHDAERDFDAVREDAALSGSAPLVGLKAEKKAAKKGKPSKTRAEAKAKPELKHVTALETKATALKTP
jgi:hypothetical protein